MADAVPVRDVLCEAMEYLSKLGSNLRVRSENLKEKRLRKDKLKNVHAVQKAASKVLLICELSKKSIENVETGVKNVLTQIDASQAPTGCGGKNIEKLLSSRSYDNYHHFEYESHILKIRDKVNVKHFISVKVLAKPMPTLLQDKYPVFHDCKLYRIRKKIQNNNKEPDLDDDSNNINLTDSSKDIGNKSKQMGLSMRKSHEECETLGSGSLHVEASNKIVKGKSNRSSSDDKINEEMKQRKYKKIKMLESSDSDKESNSEQKLTSDANLSKSVNNSNVSNNSNNDESINNKELNENAHSNLISNVSGKENGERNIPINAEDSTLNGDKQSDKSRKQDNKLQNMESSGSDIVMQDIIDSSIMQSYADDFDNNSKTTTTVKLKQSISTEKTSNNSDDNFSLPHVETANIEEHSNQSDEEGNSRQSCTVTKPTLENESSQGSSSDSKPFIKCVNINKLLREDKVPKKIESLIEILDSDSENERQTDNQKTKQFGKDKFDENKPRTMTKLGQKSDKTSKKHLDKNKKYDEEYWKQKRKEVNAFKSKDFVINITKLPKITSQYLNTNHLKRITQNGDVVCEIMKEVENEKQSSHNSKDKMDVTDINVIKNTLLHESDSDHEKTLNSQKEKNVEKKHRSKTQSTSDKDKDSNKIKSSLLYDSTDDSTPTKKRKIQSTDSHSPPSKRIHIMQSMHAKKMLLTDSSSSDTEDENLKDSLKKIRDTLLKGNSSDEENAKEKDAQAKNSSESVMALEQEDTQDTSGIDSSVKDTNSQIDECSEEKSNTCSEKVRN